VFIGACSIGFFSDLFYQGSLLLATLLYPSDITKCKQIKKINKITFSYIYTSEKQEALICQLL